MARKVHLIADRGPKIAFTRCGRIGLGGGVGERVISFYQGGGGIDVTEDGSIVTCARCLASLTQEQPHD